MATTKKTSTAERLAAQAVEEATQARKSIEELQAKVQKAIVAIESAKLVAENVRAGSETYFRRAQDSVKAIQDASREEIAATRKKNLAEYEEAKKALTEVKETQRVKRKEQEEKIEATYKKAYDTYLDAKADIRKVLKDAQEEAAQIISKANAELEAKRDEIQAIVLRVNTANDFGSAALDGSGRAYVYLTNEFVSAVGTGTYQVFIQAEEPGLIQIEEKNPAYVLLVGDPGLHFSWEAKTKV